MKNVFFTNIGVGRKLRNENMAKEAGYKDQFIRSCQTCAFVRFGNLKKKEMAECINRENKKIACAKIFVWYDGICKNYKPYEVGILY
jgi:hypothetical protein